MRWQAGGEQAGAVVSGPLRIQRGKQRLRLDLPGFGGKLQPVRCLHPAGRHPGALQVGPPDAILRQRVASLGGAGEHGERLAQLAPFRLGERAAQPDRRQDSRG